MSVRPSRDQTLIAIASVIALRGTCDRAQVGAVIAREGRPICWGFNGAPPGLPHCNENDHGWQRFSNGELMDRGFDATDPWLDAVVKEGCRNATHAEANALAFAARQGISTEGATLYLTLSPCETCARLLIAAGIVRVVWTTTYRDPAGSELLERAGIEKAVMLPDDFFVGTP